MNAVNASGLQAFQTAAARLETAAAQIARARVPTIPAASPPDATFPRAVAGQSVAPPPPAGPGGRAASFDASIISARVDMIRANQEAALAATSIRAADDMIGEVLDMGA
ncbi:hypothetical protein ACWCOP_09840 [Maricaulaceae bacterium MS644]